MKLGKYIPKKIKKPLIRLQYVPERTMFKLYRAAAQGKLYMPDKLFQKWDYSIYNDRKLSFKNPKSFNEKLQWMKYYYRNPALTQLVDKYEVRKYVSEKVGENILVPCYGIYNSWDEINFDELPNQFVMKCTHDSGSVVLCRNKETFDYDEAWAIIEKGLKVKQFYLSREWPYKNVKPRIIIEKFISNADGSAMVDYKFLCFDGKPLVVDVLTGRNTKEGLREDYFDMQWNHQKVQKDRQPNADFEIKKPECFETMREIAEKLSKGFPHIRVDFFVANGEPHFTEMTCFNDGGRIPFNPYSYDLWLGSFLKLPPKMR